MLESTAKSTANKVESIYKRFNSTIFKKYHCVEMKPVKALPIYQFKLHQVPDDLGAVLYLKPDSKIIDYLKTDTVFDMKYLPKDLDGRFSIFQTQIKSISKENRGPFKGHYKVGISIAEQ